MIREAICVASYRHSPWLQQCLDSIPSRFPVYVVRDGQYEPSALRSILNNTKLDRWLFLQDSTMVKDPSWIEDHRNKDESIGLIDDPGLYGSYLGWWRRSILECCSIPTGKTKMDAVLAEMDLPKQYKVLDPKAWTLWPELKLHSAVPECKFIGTPHERETMRYENQYFVKWKSAWNGDTMGESQIRDDRIRAL